MALKAASGRVNPLYAGSNFAAPAGGGWTEMSQHAEQYRQFRGHVYTAIRPIAARLAKQDFRIGIQMAGGPRTKKAAAELGMHAYRKVCGFRIGSQREEIVGRAPEAMRTKALAEGLEILETHAFLEAIENPNELMTKWQQSFATVASLQLTGKAYWWLDIADGLLQFWPIPSSWVRPGGYTDRNLRNKWFVHPPAGGTPIPVEAIDMPYFSYPDPSDPLTGAISPVQTQGDAVSIDHYLQRSRLSSFRQGPKPGVILTVGRMKDQLGRDTGARPSLTAEQRGDLIDTIRYFWGGVERHGDPAIIDGIIESITPWTTTPADMDYQSGDEQNRRRIFQGIGTNPICVGEIQGANRAQAFVADDVLCDNVLNPTGAMIGEVLTKLLRMRPEFQIPGVKLYVWLDECRPHDADLKLAQLQFLASHDWLAGNEARESYDMPSMAGLEKATALMPQKPPPGASTQRSGRDDQQKR